MPIDPSIALGVRPPAEQPNMLGQYAQVMALRAAQQEMEGNEGVRNALAGGVKDPYQLMQYGKQGRATAESILKVQKDDRETKKLDAEILKSTFDNSRYALGMVNDPEGLKNFSLSQIYDPVMGPLLKARGITPESIVANLDKEIATNGFANTFKKSAMGLEKFYQDQTSQRGQNMTYGAAIRGQNMTDERARYIHANPNKQIVYDTEGNASGFDPQKNTTSATMVAPNPNALALQSNTPTVSNMMLGNPATSNMTVLPTGDVPLSMMQGQPAPVTSTAAAPAQFKGRNPVVTGEMAKYEPDPNKPGALRPIAGGPADPAVINANTGTKLSVKDQQARETKYPAATLAVKTYESNTDNLIKDIKDLINDPGLDGITGTLYGRTGAYSKDSSRALALYDKIVARGGFNELQQMRNASPTGGALGNVSNQEGTQLKQSFAAVDRRQEKNDLKRVFVDLITQLEGSKERVKDAYDMTYEYKMGGKAPSDSGKSGAKTVTRTGTIDGRKVIEYSDGSVNYAD